MGSACKGSKVSTSRMGLRSTATTIFSTPPPIDDSARASSCSGTFIASSANGGVRSTTACEKRMGCPAMNCSRSDGHCMEPRGSPPVLSSSALAWRVAPSTEPSSSSRRSKTQSPGDSVSANCRKKNASMKQALRQSGGAPWRMRTAQNAPLWNTFHATAVLLQHSSLATRRLARHSQILAARSYRCLQWPSPGGNS